MASDWGPDSPATTRFRAFYDWPAPVEFDATLPDDLDGPEDERQFLLDEAPFAKLAAVRVEPVVPAATVAQGTTNPPDPDPSVTASGNDGSGDLRAEIAEVLNASLAGVCATWRPSLAHRAAAALDEAGFRLVSEDEATVERVARALFGDFDGVVDGMSFDEASEREREAYRVRARAAVRALREAGQ